MVPKAYFLRLQKQLMPYTLIFAAILTMYTVVIITMYDPEVGAALRDLQKSAPQLFQAVGMSSVIDSLAAHINTYLFGFLYKLFPLVMMLFGIYTVVVKPYTTKTFTEVLTAPYKRTSILATQGLALLIQLIVLVAYLGVLTVLVSNNQFPSELDLSAYGRLLLGLFCLLLFEGTLCFALAHLLPRAKFGVGIGLCLWFLLAQMLYQAADSVLWLKYFTPLGLFDQSQLIEGTDRSLIYLAVLVVASAVMYILTAAIFKNKKLAL